MTSLTLNVSTPPQHNVAIPEPFQTTLITNLTERLTRENSPPLAFCEHPPVRAKPLYWPKRYPMSPPRKRWSGSGLSRSPIWLTKPWMIW